MMTGVFGFWPFASGAAVGGKMVVPLFKDLGKQASDVLNKDYPTERFWEAEVTHANKTPLALTTNSYATNAGSVDNVLTFKLDSVEVKAGNSIALLDLNTRLAFCPQIAWSARFERRGTAKGPNRDHVEVAADFHSKPRDLFRIRAFGHPIRGLYGFSGVLAMEPEKKLKLMLGGAASATSDLKSVDYSLGAAIQHCSKDSSYYVTARTLPSGAKAIAKLMCSAYASKKERYAPEYSTEVLHNLGDGSTTVAVGGVWFMDGPRSVVRAKLTHDLHLCGSITQKLSDAMTVTLGAKADIRRKSDPNSMKYGVKFNVTA